MDNLVYEDTPYSHRWQGGIVALSVICIAVVLILFFKHADFLESTGPWLYLLLVPVLLVFAVSWARWPRKYQIFDNKIRIVGGSPFHFDIPFNNLEYASEGDWTDTRLMIRLNFITSYYKNVVTIVRTKGINVNITPNNPELFIENLEKARADWRQGNR